MTPSKRGTQNGRGDGEVRSYIAERWTRGQIDALTTRLASETGLVSVEYALWLLEGEDIPSDDRERLEENLASTLATLSRLATPGSKFAGLVVAHRGASTLVGFDTALASDWVEGLAVDVFGDLGSVGVTSDFYAELHARQRTKRQIQRLRSRAEVAQRDGDLTTASEILYGQIPELKRQLEAGFRHYVERPIDKNLGEGKNSRERVLIASDGSRWIAFPAEALKPADEPGAQ